jgi:hypothetical protein
VHPDFERIAVVADSAADDPAVDVASRLGAEVGALELICVSADRAASRLDRARLERLAASHGWPPAACTVLVAADASAALCRHLGRRRRTLTVVSAGREHQLAAIDQPLLVVAPTARATH